MLTTHLDSLYDRYDHSYVFGVSQHPAPSSLIRPGALFGGHHSQSKIHQRELSGADSQGRGADRMAPALKHNVRVLLPEASPSLQDALHQYHKGSHGRDPSRPDLSWSESADLGVEWREDSHLAVESVLFKRYE